MFRAIADLQLVVVNDLLQASAGGGSDVGKCFGP